MAVEIGAILTGKVTGITSYGAFVEFPDGSSGMVHISEVSDSYIKDIHEKLTENQEVTVKVLEINDKGKVSLSIKRAMPREPRPPRTDRPQRQGRSDGRPNVWTGQQVKESSDNPSFEDMMARFKSTSDEKMSDIKRSTAAKRGSSAPRRGGGSTRP